MQKSKRENRASKCIITGLLVFLIMLATIIPITAAKAEDEPLAVITGSTAEQLVACLVEEGVAVSNEQLHAGIPEAAGIFSGAFDEVGFAQGIILSTGNAGEVVGDYTVEPSTETGGGSDPDLDGLGMGNSNDTCYLTFDIVPTGDGISFQYVLASDEYEEYISFADLFGLFYAAVDENGDIIGEYQNMAWIPDTEPPQPVSVGTINQNVNTELYRSNCSGEAAGSIASTMDGFTRVMTVDQDLVAGIKYRIKLAIGDISDTSLDSNVFIKANSVSGEAAACGELSPGSKAEEGDTIEVVIYRENGSDGTVFADWQALDIDGNVIATGTVMFNDGETEKTITVPAATVTVKLLNPSGGVIITTEEAAIDELPETADESDTSLSDLTVSQGALTPAFDTETTDYAVYVANSVTGIKVTPTATNPNAAITVKGTSVVSGAESETIDLDVGENIIEVVITSEDGNVTQTYTITVIRAAEDAREVIIIGTLLDGEDNPIPGYTLELYSTPQTDVTDAAGEFGFTQVAVSGHMLVLKNPSGTALKTFVINMQEGDVFSWTKANDIISIVLEGDTIILEMVIIIDGESIEVVSIEGLSNPQTGDNFSFAWLWITLAALGLLAAVFSVRRAV